MELFHKISIAIAEIKLPLIFVAFHVKYVEYGFDNIVSLNKHCNLRDYNSFYILFTYWKIYSSIVNGTEFKQFSEIAKYYYKCRLFLIFYDC